MAEKPFVFGVAAAGENFTDREQETERLLANFRYKVIIPDPVLKMWLRREFAR